MADQDKTSRAFIIGDIERGLTIVITDPVMVVHYSKEELEAGKDNLLAGKDTSTVMAAIVRELIPVLRGVNLDEVSAAAAHIEAGNLDGLSVDEQRAVFTELDFAATMAQIVKAKGSVSTVDFCIGLDIDPADIAIMWRSVNPGKKIVEYLQDQANSANHPQVFPIDALKLDGLDIPSKWTDPKK